MITSIYNVLQTDWWESLSNPVSNNTHLTDQIIKYVHMHNQSILFLYDKANIGASPTFTEYG